MAEHVVGIGSSHHPSQVDVDRGGIVPGGYPNDSYPALLTSGEMVVPAKRLPEFMGGGNVREVPYILSTEIRADTLRLLLLRGDQRAARNG